MTIFDPGDIVVVPFPFSDLPVSKPRPALVISPSEANASNEITLLAMITTASAGRKPGDIEIQDISAAGLRTPSILRLKLFTLDNRLISRRVGALSPADREAAGGAIRGLIAL